MQVLEISGRQNPQIAVRMDVGWKATREVKNDPDFQPEKGKMELLNQR
jgi:hypothetical protein